METVKQQGIMETVKKASTQTFTISFKNQRVVEEDEVAQIAEIFGHFDFGHRGRVATSDLPTILRLLQHNIGEDEDKALRYEVDRKNRGYFTLKELVTLLSNFSFNDDTQAGLLQALGELDTDADGFIEFSQLEDYLKSVGEPLSEDEISLFRQLARDDSSDRPTLVDIKRIAQIILPKIVAENELTKGLKA